MSDHLFRKELLEARVQRLEGRIITTTPASWSFIVGIIAALTLAFLIFLCVVRYPEKIRVPGTILPDQGLLKIVPFQTGVVSALAVEEGAVVSKGQLLATISTETLATDASSTQAAVQRTLVDRRANLVDQRSALSSAARADQSSYDAQATGLDAEISALQAQAALQNRLLASAKTQLESIATVADRGFVSKRDLALRQELALSREQEYYAALQAVAAKQAARREIDQARRRSSADTKRSLSSVSAQMAEVDEQRAQVSSAYAIRAPLAGKISSLQAFTGDTVSNDTALMTIIPSRSKLEARLFVPVTAAARARAGQHVTLFLDAFPKERYGGMEATLQRIASSPITRIAPDGSSAQYYVAIALIDPASRRARGFAGGLIAGMSLEADIAQGSTRLIRWIFQPTASRDAR